MWFEHLQSLLYVLVNCFNCCIFIEEEHLPLRSNESSNSTLWLATHVTLDKLSKPQCLVSRICKIKTKNLSPDQDLVKTSWDKGTLEMLCVLIIPTIHLCVGPCGTIIYYFMPTEFTPRERENRWWLWKFKPMNLINCLVLRLFLGKMKI